MRFLGQAFGADIIARIQASISKGLEATRSGLSRQLCEYLIELPPARIHPQQLREQGKQPPSPQVPAEVTLHALGEITLVEVSKKEPELSRLWSSLLDAHHPLGRSPLCGAQQRYLIRSEQHGWLGVLAFSAAAWHLRDRDERIGWLPITRLDNLHKIVSNSRFLSLPEVRVTHPASHVQGLAARTVTGDWQQGGETAGRGRRDHHNACAESPRQSICSH